LDVTSPDLAPGKEASLRSISGSRCRDVEA
jgi:hypothetical protein